jgi:hypothetical protein
MSITNQAIRITLDHNCLIHISQNTNIGTHIRTLLNQPDYAFSIVNVGASERCINQDYSNNYESFQKFLNSIGLEGLPRLDPMFIWDFSYWDHCIFVDDLMVKLSEDISHILFNKKSKNSTMFISEKKQRNRLCDIQTMWCHIYYNNDIFLTTDNNFMKISKINRLFNIGAKQIIHPYDLPL